MNNNISEEGNENENGEANDELIISPHMYNQKNNQSLFSCDKKNENVIFCGKYYLKKKYLLLFGFGIIILVLLIWMYNNLQLGKK